MTIVNTFVEDGYRINFDWAWHLANPHLSPIPGQDYGVAAGGDVRACVTGFCSWAQMSDGLFMVSIHYGADNITYRELATVSAAVKTAHITEGAVIGTATPAGGRSPHWEYDHADGTFSPVENFITPPFKENTMTLITYGTSNVFDVIQDTGFHYSITHTQASVYSFVTGAAVDVSTAANRTSILAIADTMFAAYCAALPAGGGGVSLAQLNTALASIAKTGDLPTTEQLGEALTSTVSLVDAHVDAAFAGLVLKTS